MLSFSTLNLSNLLLAARRLGELFLGVLDLLLEALLYLKGVLLLVLDLVVRLDLDLELLEELLLCLQDPHLLPGILAQVHSKDVSISYLCN